MICERTAHKIRPYVLDIVLGGLSVGASLVWYAAIGEYLYARYGWSDMVTYMAVGSVQVLCAWGLPFVILVHLFWRCRKDGVLGAAIRAAIIAVTLAPPFLLGGSVAFAQRNEMRFKGFVARFRSQEADVAAIREWLKTSQPPVGNIELERYVMKEIDPTKYPDGLKPRFARLLKGGSIEYMYYPPPLRVLNPMDAKVLEDGCLELGWHQRDVGAWGLIIAPTKDFRQEEYRDRMAAGAYTVVGGTISRCGTRSTWSNYHRGCMRGSGLGLSHLTPSQVKAAEAVHVRREKVLGSSGCRSRPGKGRPGPRQPDGVR